MELFENCETTSNSFFKENCFLLLDNLKVESDKSNEGDSKTSTSSNYTKLGEDDDNIILDECEPMVNEYINKKRNRKTKVKKCK